MNLPTLTNGTHRDPGWRTRRNLFFQIVYGVITTVAILWLFLYVGSLHHQVETQRGNKNALATALATANSSVVALGGTPVATPSSAAPAPTATVTVSGPQGSPGASGAPGRSPTDVQVLSAVTLYCSSNTCGTPPTAAQVAQAVVIYCARSSCKGPTGTGVPGPTGVAGASGASGAPGQSATPDQIAQAVADYCSARNSCAGPAGASGASGASGVNGTNGVDGANGAPGQGVPSFTFTFTDQLGAEHDYTCSAPTYQCVETDQAQGGN